MVQSTSNRHVDLVFFKISARVFGQVFIVGVAIQFLNTNQ